MTPLGAFIKPPTPLWGGADFAAKLPNICIPGDRESVSLVNSEEMTFVALG